MVSAQIARIAITARTVTCYKKLRRKSKRIKSPENKLGDFCSHITYELTSRRLRHTRHRRLNRRPKNKNRSLAIPAIRLRKKNSRRQSRSENATPTRRGEPQLRPVAARHASHLRERRVYLHGQGNGTVGAAYYRRRKKRRAANNRRVEWHKNGSNGRNT